MGIELSSSEFADDTATETGVVGNSRATSLAEIAREAPGAFWLERRSTPSAEPEHHAANRETHGSEQSQR